MSHWEQGYGFSLVCVFPCALNCPVHANALSPLKQAGDSSVLVRNLALILASAFGLSLALSCAGLSTVFVLGFDSPVFSVSLVPGLALTFRLVPLAVLLVMIRLGTGVGFGSCLIFPPPALALGVVPVLVLILAPYLFLTLIPLAKAVVFAVTSPGLVLPPPSALVLGVALFLVRRLALAFSSAPGPSMILAL